MRIYTRTGDDGETGLFGGERRRKNDARVASYGDVDELCSHLGLSAAGLDVGPELSDLLQIQRDLFALGADLATPDPDTKNAVRVRMDRVKWLEDRIDRYEEDNPPLTQFILPGGHPTAAALHVCRAVCRRAERGVTALAEYEAVNPIAPKYLNRLSDFLFVAARRQNVLRGIAEPTWEGAGE